jgi:hypothetical protein
MVASNDNDHSGRGTVGPRRRRTVYGTVQGRPGAQGPYTYTYTYTGKRSDGGRHATPAVTDDLGSPIEIRRGECDIIGKLIDDLIAELEAKTANDR